MRFAQQASQGGHECALAERESHLWSRLGQLAAQALGHQALDLGAIGYDAVKHLVLCRIERRPPRLDLDIYPYLPRAQVETTKSASYMSLMPGAVA